MKRIIINKLKYATTFASQEVHDKSIFDSLAGDIEALLKSKSFVADIKVEG